MVDELDVCNVRRSPQPHIFSWFCDVGTMEMLGVGGVSLSFGEVGQEGTGWAGEWVLGKPFGGVSGVGGGMLRPESIMGMGSVFMFRIEGMRSKTRTQRIALSSKRPR